jgi:hypothetical protein
LAGLDDHKGLTPRSHRDSIGDLLTTTCTDRPGSGVPALISSSDPSLSDSDSDEYRRPPRAIFVPAPVVPVTLQGQPSVPVALPRWPPLDAEYLGPVPNRDRLFAALHQEDLPELISSSDPSDDEAYFEYEDGFLGALPQSPWGWKFDDGSGEWLPGIGLRQRWKSRDKELSPKPAEYRRRPSPLPQAQQAPQALAAYHSQEAVAARHTGRIAPIAHIVHLVHHAHVFQHTI